MIKTKTRQRWRLAVLEQKDSGLSIKEFCEQKQISRPSFFLWRKRLGMKGLAAQGQAPRLMREDKPTRKSPNGFMRLLPPVAREAGQDGQWGAICVETPNGYRVRAGIGADGLKGVFEALRGL